MLFVLCCVLFVLCCLCAFVLRLVCFGWFLFVKCWCALCPCVLNCVVFCFGLLRCASLVCNIGLCCVALWLVCLLCVDVFGFGLRVFVFVWYVTMCARLFCVVLCRCVLWHCLKCCPVVCVCLVHVVLARVGVLSGFVVGLTCLLSCVG